MYTIRELDTKLSLKLGDVVTNNNEGQLFDYEQRVNYLSRAYGRLVRTLKQTMGGYAPAFCDTTKLDTISIDNAPLDWIIINFTNRNEYLHKIVDSYIRIDDERQYIHNIINIPNEKWLAVINKTNDLQTPNEEKGIFYGTVIRNEYLIYPRPKNLGTSASVVITLLYETSPEWKDTSPDTKVNISAEYLDMLLTLAAAEGMSDAARSDKFQMFVADINNQITSIANYMNLQLQLEGKHSGK